MQLGFYRYKSGTPIARFGGAWDPTTRSWVGDAQTERIIEVHAAQVEAVDLFYAWLQDHLRGDRPDYSDRIREILDGKIHLDDSNAHILGLSELFFTGGRRAGKTAIMEALAVAYNLTVDGSTVWTMTPADTKHPEPIKVLKSIMPLTWYEYNGSPQYSFYLLNGSTHRLISGFAPGNLKQGEATLVCCNEAQQIKAQSYQFARGATVDRGGFTMVAANPPVEGDQGTWVLDAVVETENGTRYGAKHFFFDPLENPHVDVTKLLALKSSMTLHDFETQVRGRMLQLPNRVLYEWDRSGNEQAFPELGDCTREFLAAHEGDGVKWSGFATVDVQSYPWIAVGIWRVSIDPADPGNRKAGVLHMVDEVAISAGDEEDAAEEMKRRGYDPATLLLIMDASCDWQQMERDVIRQKPKYTGKGSMAIFRACGFKHVVPPDRKMKRNPDIFDRIRATNASVKPARGVRGLKIDPAKCPNAVDSARKWSMKKGMPGRREGAAHFGDVMGYAVWRFFPRRGNAQRILDEMLPQQGLPESVAL
jgi:hypothetical protein